MKILRIAASRIFLGNTAGPFGRFAYHLWALVLLLLTSGLGNNLRNFAELLNAHDMPVTDNLVQIMQVCNVSIIASIALGSYLLLVTAVLVAVGMIRDALTESDATV